MDIFPRIKKLDVTKIKEITRNIYNSVYRYIKYDQGECQQLVFIFGSQRSGTTLMKDTLGKDREVKIFAEHSRLSGGHPEKLRLKPLPEVKRELERERAPIIVLKPLVETQNAAQLLEFFEGSKALWMYRDYRDVALSKLKKSGLGNGIRDMQHILERTDNWRAEHVPEHVREVVAKHYSPDMGPYDGAALYWYVRNSFLFEQQLAHDPRVMLCKYEELTGHPVSEMERIYGFIARHRPNPAWVENVHASSVGKGAGIRLSPAITELCEEMLTKLDTAKQAHAVQFTRKARRERAFDGAGRVGAI